MSLQVCNYCGWSKVTTYHGLRTHQGKMGCTKKGTRIPQDQQSSYIPRFLDMGRPIQIEEPFVPKSHLKSEPSWDMDEQVCHCGWSRYTTFQALREHQEKKGCNRGALRILEEPRQEDSWPNAPRTLTPPNLISQTNPAVGQATTMELLKAIVGAQQNFLQIGTNSLLDFAARPLLMPTPQTSNPPTVETPTRDVSQSYFETPQRSHQTASRSGNACRTLNFFTGEQQVENLWELPTNSSLNTAIIQEEEEKKKEEEERKEEGRKLLKARKDQMRAVLQQKIQVRERKVAEVRSSAGACKGVLDAEWLEINDVFTAVMRVVEDARDKALKPLEKRRQDVENEAQTLTDDLQTEIDALKQAVDELDRNTDVPVSNLTSQDGDRKSTQLNTSIVLGSLRGTTSAMMNEIQQKLEELSAVELKRMPKFAVDVKLDPNSAHPYLALSEDAKEVRDSGRPEKVPEAPERFDSFGSVLGLDALASGRAYWEVAVGNKTGWDLGVTRRGANRKGKVTLNPENGYWATVHYADKDFAALTSPPVSLSLKEKPKKVGVFVDRDEGLVSFYDVSARSHIYSFTGCAFADELLPYFSPHPKENGKNADPLVISAVKK